MMNRYPSGGYGRGGILLAIQLSGSAWTPNRDYYGNVLSSDFGQLPSNTWVTVQGTGSALNDVIETPHYPSGSGGDGSIGIVAAWGGAGWDYSNQRMLITGGGHSDSSAADVGIYALDAHSLKFTRVVNRQAQATALHWNGSALVSGDGFQPYNSPLSTGYPGSFHTYDALVWVPPATMSLIGFPSNLNGGVFYPGAAKAVVNLDNGACSALNWQAVNDIDWSYAIGVLDGTTIVSPHSSFNFLRIDFAQSEYTDWPTLGGTTTLSRGKHVTPATSSTQFVYNNKAFGWLRERREIVSFYGNQTATRVRYGQAVDAAVTDWTAYHDAITLTSVNGTDNLDFSSANLLDTGTNLLQGAGVHYDDAAGCIWVQANTASSSLYKVTGIAGSTWTVLKVPGTSALTQSTSGTFGRMRVAKIAACSLAMRVSSTTTQVEVMRITA